MSQQSEFPAEIAILPPLFQRLYLQCPEIVTRKTLAELSGGLVKDKTLSNLDAQDKGPKGRVIWRKKTIYTRIEAIVWLFQYATGQK